MSFSLMNVLLLVAAAQGFFLTIVIIRQAIHLYAARFLSVLVFLYSFLLTLLLLHDLKLGGIFLYIYIFFAGMPFVIGPLHYFYARHLLEPSSRLQRIDLLHFLPAVLISLSFLPFQFIPKQQLASAIIHADQSLLSPIELIFNFGIFLHALIYSLMTLRMLRYHSWQLRTVFASVDKTQVRWLRRMTLLAIICIGVFIMETLFMLFGVNLSNYFQLSSFFVALYVYALGYNSINRADLTSADAKRIQLSEKHVEQKYQKSGLSDDIAEKMAKKLEKIMEEEKPFHDPGLILNQLAEISGISPHNISQVLNTRLGLNFFDFVNSYRLREVKRALLDEKQDHLTILAIAFDAGFNSKTAFNTIFKKTQDCTPSEFRKHR